MDRNKRKAAKANPLPEKPRAFSGEGGGVILCDCAIDGGARAIPIEKTRWAGVARCPTSIELFDKQGHPTLLLLEIFALLDDSDEGRKRHSRLRAVARNPSLSPDDAQACVESEQEFHRVFGAKLTGWLLKPNSAEFVVSLIACLNAVQSGRDDSRAVDTMLRCIEHLVETSESPPTKAVLKKYLNSKLPENRQYNDKRFATLLKKTGFGWLPAGKPGPKI
ncbi:MAG TPA: hypothetical protein VIM69_01455 [Opitutaceae bacterium]